MEEVEYWMQAAEIKNGIGSDTKTREKIVGPATIKRNSAKIFWWCNTKTMIQQIWIPVSGGNKLEFP